MSRLVVVLFVIGAAVSVPAAIPASSASRGPERSGTCAIPEFGQPFMVDRSCRPGYGYTDYPGGAAVASDGSRWLVAWTGDVYGVDDRTRCLWVRAVGSDGMPDETRPPLCVRGPGIAADQVSVSYGAGVYMVVWAEQVRDYSIWAVRVSRAGELLDARPIELSREGGDRAEPDVAFDGENFFVAWSSGRWYSYRVRATRVTPTGRVLDRQALQMPGDGEYDLFPSVAYCGGNYLVAWQSGGDEDFVVRFARVSTDGVLLDSCATTLDSIGERDRAVAVGATDSCWLIAWAGLLDRATWTYGVAARRVASDGRLLDPVSIRVRTSPECDGTQLPAVAGKGDRFVVAWVEDTSWYSTATYALVGSDGSVSDTVPVHLGEQGGGWGGRADIAWNGREALVAWPGGGQLDECLVTCRVAEDGVPADTIVAVSLLAAEQRCTAVASNGETFLAVWTEEGDLSDELKIFAIRLGSSGVLDSAAITLSSTYAPSWVHGLAVAAAGSLYLTAGETFDGIACQRVSPAGVLMDSLPIWIRTTGANDGSPACASDGRRWLVAWTSAQVSGRAYFTGTFVEPDGSTPNEYAFVVDRPTSAPVGPVVAHCAGGYLVAWLDCDSVIVARVTDSGELLDPEGLVIGCTRGGSSVCIGAGDPFLVAWADWDPAGNLGTITGCRIGMDGIPLDIGGRRLGHRSRVLGDGCHVSAARSGTGWQLAWDDTASTHIVSAVRVGFDGSASEQFIVPRSDSGAYYPVLTSGRNGLVLCTWNQNSRFVDGWGYFADRVWASFGPFPGPALGLPEEAESRRGATLVRGVLHVRLGTRYDFSGQKSGRSRAALLDAAGRKVMELQEGANDVSALAPGVYFVCQKGSRDLGTEGQSRKVIIQK